MKNVLVFFLAGLFVLGSLLIFIGFSMRKKARLEVNSEPVAAVYVDGQNVGTTPYGGTFRAGEHVLGLVLTSGQARFETNMQLSSGVTTVVNRVFNSENNEQMGEIITFEKTGEKDSSISIVSDPDAVAIMLNGQAKGYTPSKIDGLLAGAQSLTLQSPGFSERNINLNTVAGYKIVLITKLAMDPNYKPVNYDEVLGMASPKEEETTKAEKVLILSTPTGFLRVRSEANTAATEIAQVKPGEEFNLIGEEEGWINIDLGEGKTGWVSSQYASKATVEDTNN